MYNHDEVTQKTLEYFNGNELATNVFVSKYALRDNEDNYVELTPDDMHHRIAKEFARIEKKKFKKPLSEDEIYNLLKNYSCIIPQGSPLYGIGNPYKTVSLSNCFVVESPIDSYGGICQTDEHIVQISKRRGGIGYDISNLRPKNSFVKNSARTTTGAVSFMHRFSHTGREVGQNNRRAAQMITMSVHHPDIEEFINVKNEETSVTGANISIRLSNEFLNAVKKDTEYELRWPIDNPKVSKMVSAKAIWDKIIHSAWLRAEPGLLFWDNVIEQSVSDCYFKTISTNPSLRHDTLVLTDEGVFPIKWLAENKSETTVLNCKNEWSKCKVFKSGENKQLVKITFSNQQVVYCTKEHKWPVLNSSNTLFSKKDGSVIKKESINLKKQDKIYFPLNNTPIDNKDCKFSKLDGFVLGWNQGDGWISYHTRNKSLQYGFIFSEEDCESNIGQTILDYTNKLAKLPSKLRRDHDTKSFCYVTTDNNVLSQMETLGAINKKEGIPKTVWTGNDNFVKGYVDGIFSSDGYVECKEKLSNCRIILVSAYKNLIYDIQKLLSFYGIRSNIKYSLTSGKYNRYDLTISGIHCQHFSNIFSLSNKNKQNKLSLIKQLEVGVLNEKNRIQYSNNRNYISVQKVEITDIYEDVYDITVFDDTHTFVTEVGVTGNCSEITIPADESCRLLAINLMYFVINPYSKKAYFDYEKFFEIAQIAQRLMDDLVDLEEECIKRIIKKIKNDPEPQDVKQTELNLWTRILKMCQSGRRTGLGITALGDTIAALGIKYGSKKSISITEDIYKTLKLGSYRSSVDMAKELGSFPVWDWEKEKDLPFLLRIKEDDLELYNDMAVYGRRNIANLTTAPTGTISTQASITIGEKTVFGTTSGIEPCYLMSYKRRKKINPNETGVTVDFVDKLGDKWMEFDVYHPGVELWMEVNNSTIDNSPYSGSCADEIDWLNRVRLQAAAQRHVDHAISSTINLPNDVKEEEVAKIYTTAWKENLKGITVYRDGCRSGVLVKKEKEILPEKRPRELDCDVHHITTKGEKYFVLVGLQDDKPYEVFAGKNGFLDPKLKSGKIIRKKKNFYKAVFDDETEIAPITACMSEMEECISRLTSSLLRVGADMHFVVQQLEKVGETKEMHCFTRCVSRALKKYIPDGTKEKDKCPECDMETLERKEGCLFCVNCSYSKCT